MTLDLQDPGQEIAALESLIVELENVLHECADYFDNRADVSDSEDGPVANEELRLLTAIKAVL